MEIIRWIWKTFYALIGLVVNIGVLSIWLKLDLADKIISVFSNHGISPEDKGKYIIALNAVIILFAVELVLYLLYKVWLNKKPLYGYKLISHSLEQTTETTYRYTSIYKIKVLKYCIDAIRINPGWTGSETEFDVTARDEKTGEELGVVQMPGPDPRFFRVVFNTLYKGDTKKIRITISNLSDNGNRMVPHMRVTSADRRCKNLVLRAQLLEDYVFTKDIINKKTEESVKGYPQLYTQLDSGTNVVEWDVKRDDKHNVNFKKYAYSFSWVRRQ